MKIYLEGTRALRSLAEQVGGRGGQGELRLVLRLDDVGREVEFVLPQGIDATPKQRSALKLVAGRGRGQRPLRPAEFRGFQPLPRGGCIPINRNISHAGSQRREALHGLRARSGDRADRSHHPAAAEPEKGECSPMALPNVSMRQLLEAGVHFGHQTHRWNPKMAPFIYGSRNNIHIIDLTQTVPLLHQALLTVADTVAKGGRVLFVGTKRQASEAVADAAQVLRAVLRQSPLARRHADQLAHHLELDPRLKSLEELLGGETQGLTKKELLQLTREKDKLERSLGGIKDMGALPDLMFVIDTNKEAIAIAEARKLDMPIVAVVDSNCDPDGISHPIPGNDDAGRAITLYCDLIARAAIDGIERAQGSAGVDLGAAERRAARGRSMKARRARARRSRRPHGRTQAPAAEAGAARRKSRQWQGPVAGEARPRTGTKAERRSEA